MNNLDKRKKVSDGIRHLKIKKNISIGTNTGESFSSKDNHRVERINNESIVKKKTAIMDNYSKDISNRTNSLFNFFRKNRIFLKNIIFVLLYLYILFFIFNKLENTDIYITPKTEEILKKEIIRSYLKPEYGQLGFSIIMLSESREKIVKSDKELNVSDRASGEITIFNNYSTEPQRLSPNTRFKSISGKIFKTQDKWIEIPGKTVKGPGTIKVIVYADETGPGYNIDVTDFTIPGFKEAGFTAKYNDIYALSLKSFTGGFEGKRLELSESKKKKTIVNLEDELKEVLIKELNIEKTDRAILVNNSVQIVFEKPIIENDFDKEETKIIQNAKIFAILIDKKNLEDFLKRKYLHDVNKKDIFLLDSSKLNFNYSSKKIDFEKLKEVNIETNIDAIFEWRLDSNLIKESLRGLNKKDVSKILKEFVEINYAVIKIKPFWQKFISYDINKIKITNSSKLKK